MRIYLHPNGWPVSIDDAPCGLLVRERKGRVDLFLKVEKMEVGNIERIVFNIEGKAPTTVTGKVTPVRLMKESESK